MRFNDAVLGAIVAAFGLFVIVEAGNFPGLPGQAYGPAFFPEIIGSVLAASGALLVVQGIATSRRRAFVTWGDWITSPRHIVNFLIVPVSLVAYILFSKALGFIPISLIILGILIRRFGGSWMITVIASITTTMLIHTLFYQFLHVPLPWGLLDPIAW